MAVRVSHHPRPQSVRVPGKGLHFRAGVGSLLYVTKGTLHWPKESTEGQESFELVVFSSYKVEESAPYLGETRAWIGEATWESLDRATVEVLVGEKV